MTRKLHIELLDSTRKPFAQGAVFGDAGAYEVVTARASFSYRPSEIAAEAPYDLQFARTGADGLARGSSDVWILKPVDLALGSGTLLFEFLNRGNKRSLQFFNDAAAANNPTAGVDAGNGWLMRRGHVLVSAAWQADVLPGNGRQVLEVPSAWNDGQPLSAPVSAEFIADAPGIRCLPLSAKASTRSLPAHPQHRDEAVLTRRRYPWSDAEVVPRGAWALARIESGGAVGGGDRADSETGIVPSDAHLLLPGGFEPGWIYELRYIAQDPLVLDLGFLLVRDLVSVLRSEGSAPNPLAQGGQSCVRTALAWGRSQAGRAIREFVYRGFNESAEGSRVFDGVLPHVSGAGRVNMNRFSNLDIAASRQYETHAHPADRFPFAYAATVNPVTGRSDAILKRPRTDPLVIHTQTSTEYWNRRGSLVHTDAQGNDLPEPDGVRIFAWTGSQHWADPNTRAVQAGICQNLPNVVASSALLRAALSMLERWVDGEAPPASRHPRRVDGTLVSFDEWRQAFPAIPGVQLPQQPNTLQALDHGTVFEAGIAAPLETPVRAGARFEVLVPACDGDGQDLGGLRPPMAEVAVATFTGWNLRARGFGEGALHDFSGSAIPFPSAADHRRATRDPRPSFEERHGDMERYARAVRDHALDQVSQRLLLREDVDVAVSIALHWARVMNA